MASPGLRVLSRVIRTGCLDEVIKWGVSTEDFQGAMEKSLYFFILTYHQAKQTAGAVPDHWFIHTKFPTFEMCDPPVEQVTTASLCQELRTDRLRVQGRKMLEELSELIDGSPLDALTQMRGQVDGLLNLGTKSEDVQFASAMERIQAQYMLAKQGMHYAKVLWPWDILNDATAGIHSDDYIVFYGRPKSMKSWVLSYLIGELYMNGANVLVYTKEMTPDSLLRRVAACIQRFPYQELRSGKLSLDEEYQLDQLVTGLVDEEKKGHRLTTLAAGDLGDGQLDTVAWLQSKVKEYKPDVVFVDGLYLMSETTGGKNQADHQRVMKISRQTRQMILNTKVPVIATMQANRQAAKNQTAQLDEIAYSDAIAQDATGIFRVINEKKTPTIALVAGGTREYKIHGVRIHGIPATDFSFKEAMTERDIMKAKEDDQVLDEQEDSENIGKKRRPVSKTRQAETDATEKRIDDALSQVS